jgi:hypothetical protein
VPKSDRKILTPPYKIRIGFLLLSHRNGRNVARGIRTESDQNRFQGYDIHIGAVDQGVDFIDMLGYTARIKMRKPKISGATVYISILKLCC